MWVFFQRKKEGSHHSSHGHTPRVVLPPEQLGEADEGPQFRQAEASLFNTQPLGDGNPGDMQPLRQLQQQQQPWRS